jgi:hypothetical protein
LKPCFSEKNRNYSGTPIFKYNTDFIGLILKTEKFEYLILKFNKPMISMNYVYKNSGTAKSSKKSHVISIS